MKKWLLGIFLVLLVGFSWLGWDLYDSNRSLQSRSADRAITEAKNNYRIGKVKSVAYFHGTSSYQVVEGMRNGAETYVWVPDQKKKAPFIIRRANRGISRSRAMQIFLSKNLHPQKIVSIHLGAINTTPIWQVIFLTQNDTYNYLSINFDTGKEVQRILNI